MADPDDVEALRTEVDRMRPIYEAARRYADGVWDDKVGRVKREADLLALARETFKPATRASVGEYARLNPRRGGAPAPRAA